MTDGTTYDVRVYRTQVYKGARVTTYKVRWKTDRRLWKEGFRNAALADSFRSSLLTAARKGEAFSLSNGRPASWKRDESSLTWYALTLDYAATKWPYAAPNHLSRLPKHSPTPPRHARQRRELLPYRGHPPSPADLGIQRPAPRCDRTARRPGGRRALAAERHHPGDRTHPLWDRHRPVPRTARPISRKQDGTAAAANTANRNGPCSTT